MATEQATVPPTAAPPPAEPASTPALNLVIALHRLLRDIRSVLPEGPFNGTQLLVLSQLAGAEPTRIGELAQHVRCSQPTATTVVNGLAADGLVQRIKDTADGRAIKVSLTDLGRQTLREFGERQAAYLESLIDQLPEDERAIMLSAIPIMARMAGSSTKGNSAAGGVSGGRAGTWGRSRTSGS